MVRLDDESKSYLAQAAKLRRVSVSDYVRAVTVAQSRREVLAARESTFAMTVQFPRTFRLSAKRLEAMMETP